MTGRRAAAAVVVAAALALPACGGGDGDSEDAAQIEDVVTHVFRGGDPIEICDRFTPAGLRAVARGARGADARRRCEQAVTDQASEPAIDVGDPTVNGERARVSVGVDGQGFDLELRKVDGNWLIDGARPQPR